MWYIIPHTKTKISRSHVHTCTRTHVHTGTRADFFFGMYQLETCFARIVSCLLYPLPSTRVLFTMSYINIVLNIIPTLCEGYIVHRMVVENRPVDPGRTRGSHRPISFIRIKHRTRANDILCKTEY